MTHSTWGCWSYKCLVPQISGWRWGSCRSSHSFGSWYPKIIHKIWCKLKNYIWYKYAHYHLFIVLLYFSVYIMWCQWTTRREIPKSYQALTLNWVVLCRTLDLFLSRSRSTRSCGGFSRLLQAPVINGRHAIHLGLDICRKQLWKSKKEVPKIQKKTYIYIYTYINNYKYTYDIHPLKLRWNLKNGEFVKEFPFPERHFQVSCFRSLHRCLREWGVINHSIPFLGPY